MTVSAVVPITTQGKILTKKTLEHHTIAGQS